MENTLGVSTGDMSCPICYDGYKSPVVLSPCGHAICSSCKTNWGNHKDNLCPVCGSEIEVFTKSSSFMSVVEYSVPQESQLDRKQEENSEMRKSIMTSTMTREN